MAAGRPGENHLCGWTRLLLCNPLHPLPEDAAPPQPPHTALQATNPSREGHHGHYCAVLMITCFLLGSGSSSSAEGLKEFPLGWGKHMAELKIYCLGTGEAHSAKGPPSSCQDGRASPLLTSPSCLQEPTCGCQLPAVSLREPGPVALAAASWEKTSEGSAEKVTLSILTSPTCESHRAAPRALHLSPLHCCLCPPTPICKWRNEDLQNTGFVQPPSPGGSHLQDSHITKTTPSSACSLGESC